VVAKARTDADGTYRVAVDIKNKRFYQASFKGGDKCAPALSGQIKVAGTN